MLLDKQSICALCICVHEHFLCAKCGDNFSHVIFKNTIFFSFFFSLCHSSRNFECLQKELGRLVYFSQFDAKIFSKCKAFNGEDEGEAGERNKR